MNGTAAEGAAPTSRAGWLEEAARVLDIEAEALARLRASVVGDGGDAFIAAAATILELRGRLVVVGMGKSGIIAKKIAATFASTGTPAFFVHAAEAQHGDLGMITRQDVVLALSHSGETDEVRGLLPTIKRLGAPLIAVTGRPDSSLGRHADVALRVPVAREACPMNLAPTASTTAALALGDALAVVVLKHRGFREEDFARVHPAGSLGRRLMRVGELMHAGDELPMVAPGTRLREAIVTMSACRLGITGVACDGELVGCLTDGDLRRILEAGEADLDVEVSEVMHPSPHRIGADALASEAVRRMEEREVTALFVVDEEGRPVGAVHMHDLLRAGVA